MNPDVYLIAMCASCIAAVAASLVVNRKSVKGELTDAVKQDITKEQMWDAEQVISDFLSEAGIPPGASIYEIGAVLNIRDGGDVEWLPGQARLSRPDQDGIMTVTFRRGLSRQERMFAFAHECGHRINKDVVPADRPTGRHKDSVEQAADYVAAALLMPLEQVYAYLEDNHFRTAPSRERVKITRKLGKIYGVDMAVALRRIREVYAVKGI